ncbi:aminotransferase class I/II-fold pyridoxal phosphate-dependent enzyme [Dichotomicrobium thermohalophilum]|uniref:Aspartate/methionine/tyrosine aminotransferase n=1 Tax=Dichotomicrobium thermohalophilum TaxID=933063 RepID=A0A397Q4V1_9HYPH|nr:aminotransferase class I/II-fold pyridoxal phosphate-dependent enzyme [Dichotomicrobium thermohalophilum]RIA55973.1 aspartate/methionine/tyrosine aminotransferase [Dichotomicrobium thermohalophilum]
MVCDLGKLVRSPFARLRSLLGSIEPGAEPIDMSIGAPRHPMPDFVADIIHDHAADWQPYPPIRGTDGLRKAVANWHGLRYPSLREQIDPEAHILPLSGSREGLFSATFLALARKPHVARPVVLIPNPFYQAYAAGALVGGAEPRFLPTTEATGFLPDFEAVPEDVLARSAAIFLASPANPQGVVASRPYLHELIALARRWDVMLFLDECYSEIYSDAPPPGALEVAAETGSLANVVSFNSLSKRSNVPGLRSGFCAGDPDFISRFAGFRNVACPQMPLPVQHASAALWGDEAHVEANRALYREKFEIAGSALGIRAPAGGFFLWLDASALGGGEEAALHLWREAGVKVIPGAYLAVETDGAIPGAERIRVALVGDAATTREGLMRTAEVLGPS